MWGEAKTQPFLGKNKTNQGLQGNGEFHFWQKKMYEVNMEHLVIPENKETIRLCELC